MICAPEMVGILLMVASGVSVTCEMVTSKIIENMHWPYWYLLAACCTGAALANGTYLCWAGIGCPKKQDIKWVVARALFENLHWMLAIWAVLVGAAPGDVAALTSIDIMAAAFLGLIFLGESVTILHFVALVVSLTGAVCISQPQFIFGASEQTEQSPLGYCMALLSGCFQAGAFVCARKSKDIPVSVLTIVSLLFAVLLAFVPPLLGLSSSAHDALQTIQEEPWHALGLLAILTIWCVFSIVLPAAGATRCPAAVSATVFTSSSMISGYIAQTTIFNDAPTPLKLLGAGFMLSSVVMMAVRCRDHDTAEEREASRAEEHNPASTADETDSLGSFVASEVSFGKSGRLRRRGTVYSNTPTPQRLGSCLPIFAVSSA